MQSNPTDSKNASNSPSQTLITLTEYVRRYSPVILPIAEMVWEAVIKRMNSYSKQELAIIDGARKFYKDVFESENYPTYLQYSGKDEPKTYNPHLFPACELEDKNIEFNPVKFGSNEVSPQCEAVIKHLINYYNFYRLKWFRGNSRAVQYVFLFLIDIMYALSKVDLKKIEILKEVQKYILYIEKLRTITEFQRQVHESDKTDAEKRLTEILSILLKQTKPKIVRIHAERGAKDYLEQLKTALSNMCHAGFKIALFIASKDKISPDVSLVTIQEEKGHLKGGDPNVRKYAIPRLSTTRKPQLSQFLIGLSSSLLARLENNSVSIDEFFVSPNLKVELADAESDFYSPFKKKFVEHYYQFCFALESFSHLFLLIQQSTKICDRGGELFYFIVANEAANNLMRQVNVVLKVLETSFQAMLREALDQSMAITRTNMNGDDKRWHVNYNTVKKEYIDFVKKYIDEIKELCSALEQLQFNYDNNTQDQIKRLFMQCENFCNNVFDFHNRLIGQGLIQGQQIKRLNSSSYKKGGNEMKSSLHKLLSPSVDLPVKSELIIISGMKGTVQWEYCPKEMVEQHDDVINQLVGSVVHYTIKKSFLEYGKTERSLICNKSILDIKDHFKNYSHLDDKLSTLMREYKDKKDKEKRLAFLFYLRIELANRQIRHLASLVNQDKCTIDQLRVHINSLAYGFQHVASITQADATVWELDLAEQLKSWSTALKDINKAKLIELAIKKLTKKDNNVQPAASKAKPEPMDDNSAQNHASSHIKIVKYLKSVKSQLPTSSVANGTLSDDTQKLLEETKTVVSKANQNAGLHLSFSELLSNVQNTMSKPQENYSTLLGRLQKDIDRTETISRRLALAEELRGDIFATTPLKEDAARYYTDAMLSKFSIYGIEEVCKHSADKVRVVRRINSSHRWGGVGALVWKPFFREIQNEGLRAKASAVWNSVTPQPGSAPFPKPRAGVTDPKLFKDGVRKQIEDALVYESVKLSKL